ncbi:unnamed protein product, partial [Angiostrongylus costaricensis]|uniref:Repressor of RNA polymerase III transcription MAF1 homolog n=1 Tax=Angiostrongylus costaricensis TaxID=334426 RepID=A0A0R3PHV4_ANGCS
CLPCFRLESYSCKMVQSDKKQWKTFGGPSENDNAHERQPLSPPDDFLCISASPIGHSGRMRHLSEAGQSGSETDFVLLDSISKRTLFDLIGVLNIAYPDYDFSNVKSSSFSLIPSVDQISDLHFREEGFDLMTQVFFLFSFKSNYSDDPFSEDGCLWWLNFFFHNKTLKRVLLLSCRAMSQSAAVSDPLWDLDEE